MYKEDWTNAETASNSLIALGTYSLMPDVRSVFSLANQNNVESIFEVQYRDILNGKVNWNGNVAYRVSSSRARLSSEEYRK